MNTNEEEQIRVGRCVLVLDFIHVNDSLVSETAEIEFMGGTVAAATRQRVGPARLRDGFAAGYLRAAIGQIRRVVREDFARESPAFAKATARQALIDANHRGEPCPKRS